MKVVVSVLKCEQGICMMWTRVCRLPLWLKIYLRISKQKKKKKQRVVLDQDTVVIITLLRSVIFG